VRYWFFALLGLVICGASIVAIDWGIYHLIRTGTCSSGGPYVSARPCPPGTGGHILAVIGGVFGGLIGVGVWAARGRSEERRESPYPLPLLMWTLLFCGIALSGLYAVLGPAAPEDAPKGTAIFLAALFIPMGLAPVPLAWMGRRKGERAADLVQHGKRCRGVVVSVEDTNWTVNDNPRVKMTVRAEPDGETPFTIEKTSVVPRVSIPRAGDHCVVFYNPSDPQNQNGITFDPVPGFDAGRAPAPAPEPAPAPTPTPVAERIMLATATPTEKEASEVAAAETEGDPIEKIEKLDRLREKGIITQAEFEMQKQRLLREV
jgi:Short C-terminal domain/Protein of unknown function (DUF3592)